MVASFVLDLGRQNWNEICTFVLQALSLYGSLSFRDLSCVPSDAWASLLGKTVLSLPIVQNRSKGVHRSLGQSTCLPPVLCRNELP